MYVASYNLVFSNSTASSTTSFDCSTISFPWDAFSVLTLASDIVLWS